MKFKLLPSEIRLLNLNAILGYMSGLPLLLTSTTLQAWFLDAGNDLVTIGYLSLIGLPYTLKFLWSPMLDALHGVSDAPRRFWLLFGQCFIFWLMLLLSFLNPKNMPMEMAVIAFLITIFSATQDIAVDAYRQVFTPNKLRTLVVSLTTSAYRIAMVISGGVALILADHIGWSFTYKVMAAQVFVGFFFTWSLAKPYEDYSSDIDYSKIISEPFKKLFQVQNINIMLAIIILYKISDAFLLNFLQPFLLQGLGYSKSYVGSLVKIFGLAASIFGAFSASFISSKIDMKKTLIFFGWFQVATVLLFVALSYYHSSQLAIVAVFAESFSAGATGCLLISIFMYICNDNNYAATQIAFLTAISSLPRVAMGPIAGYVAKTFGWHEFFIISTVVAVPGVLLLQCYSKGFFDNFNLTKVESV
jgi:PAT family beta-lactamase induction signal transducer AmpG